MNDNSEEHTRVIAERTKENLDKVQAEIDRIVRLHVSALTENDRRFLVARRDYLTRAQLGEYQEIIDEQMKKDIALYATDEVKLDLKPEVGKKVA